MVSILNPRSRPPNADQGALSGVSVAFSDDGGTPTRGQQRPLLLVPTLIATYGVVLISIGYADSYAGARWATAVVWIGQLVVFLPLAITMVAPNVPRSARVVAVGAQAGFQSVIKWMYSPLDFRFPDELLHWRTAWSVLNDHHLFHANPALSISPSFPGLEETTAYVASVTHLSLFAAGSIVAAVSHVGVSLAAYSFVRMITGSDRVGSTAALLFAVSPHHPFFNAGFIYEAPALLLMVLVFVFAFDAHGRRPLALGLASLLLAAVIVTHHVTAAVTTSVLVLSFMVAAVRHDPLVRALGYLSALGVALATAWVAGVAHGLFSYLAPPLQDALQSIGELSAGGGGANSGKSLPLTLSYLAVCLTLFLATLGFVRVSRTTPTVPVRAFSIASISYVGVLGFRAVATSSEIAGRALTYSLFFASITMAIALNALWPPGARAVRQAGITAAVTVIAAGFAMIGWPPLWETTPGRYHIDAFESGIDRAGILGAQWMRRAVGPGHRVACDFSACWLVASYGFQAPVPGVSRLYYATTVGPPEHRFIQTKALSMAVVDAAISEQLPREPSAGYFLDDQYLHSHRSPLPFARLDKFARARGMTRLYDNGRIAIYDLRLIQHALSP
jgi:hypothetical protein